MSRNKSANHRKARHERLEKLHNPPQDGHFSYVIGNLSYEAMERLCADHNVSHSDILCGYLCQPINYSGSNHHISGGCVLHEKMSKCEYEIDFSHPHNIVDSCPVYRAFFGMPALDKDVPSPLEDKLDD